MWVLERPGKNGPGWDRFNDATRSVELKMVSWEETHPYIVNHHARTSTEKFDEEHAKEEQSMGHASKEWMRENAVFSRIDSMILRDVSREIHARRLPRSRAMHGPSC